MKIKVEQITPTPGGGHQCNAPKKELRPGRYRDRMAERMDKRGFKMDQCGNQSAWRIDGVYYCQAHAGSLVLDRLNSGPPLANITRPQCEYETGRGGRARRPRNRQGYDPDRCFNPWLHTIEGRYLCSVHAGIAARAVMIKSGRMVRKTKHPELDNAPQCSALVAFYNPKWSNHRSGEDLKRCCNLSPFEIDGVPYCPTHAGKRAVSLMGEGT